MNVHVNLSRCIFISFCNTDFSGCCDGTRRSPSFKFSCLSLFVTLRSLLHTALCTVSTLCACNYFTSIYLRNSVFATFRRILVMWRLFVFYGCEPPKETSKWKELLNLHCVVVSRQVCLIGDVLTENVCWWIVLINHVAYNFSNKPTIDLQCTMQRGLFANVFVCRNTMV